MIHAITTTFIFNAIIFFVGFSLGCWFTYKKMVGKLNVYKGMDAAIAATAKKIADNNAQIAKITFKDVYFSHFKKFGSMLLLLGILLGILFFLSKFYFFKK